VGYESVTQFTREFDRLFGAPPVYDMKAKDGMAAA
jgi:AraC-like DNA-binding protein